MPSNKSLDDMTDSFVTFDEDDVFGDSAENVAPGKKHILEESKKDVDLSFITIEDAVSKMVSKEITVISDYADKKIDKKQMSEIRYNLPKESGLEDALFKQRAAVQRFSLIYSFIKVVDSYDSIDQIFDIIVSVCFRDKSDVEERPERKDIIKGLAQALLNYTKNGKTDKLDDELQIWWDKLLADLRSLNRNI